MNDRREYLYEDLLDSTGENSKSKALDRAAKFYYEMSGDSVTTGEFEELMERAVDQGSVTPGEIAEVLDTEELPVEAETEWSVGEGDI